MKSPLLNSTFCLVVAAQATSVCIAAEDELAALRRRQHAEEQAQSLAEELIASVLDTQLRQLEENGLKSLPIYRDIAGMRANITMLAKEEMPAVVELLIAAQSASPTDRGRATTAAREKIRELLCDSLPSDSVCIAECRRFSFRPTLANWSSC